MAITVNFRFWVMVFYAGFLPYFLALVTNGLLAVWALSAVFAVFLLRIPQVLLFALAFTLLQTGGMWYAHTALTSLAETDIVFVKSQEMIFYAILLRVFLERRGRIHLARPFRRLISGILFVIASGVVVALVKEVPVRDMLIYSEFRNLLLGVAMIIVLFELARNIDPAQVLYVIVVLIWVKMLASVPDYLFGIPLLWYTAVPNYAGSSSAFLGSITDMLLLLWLGAFYLVKTLGLGSQGKKNFYMDRNTVLLGIVVLIILLTQKRSILLAFSLMGVAGLLLSGYRYKIWVSLIGMATALAMVALYYTQLLPGSIMSAVDRVTGEDEKVQMSNEGRLLDVLDGINIVQNSPIFGEGVGSRVTVSRAYLLSEDKNADYLMLHQGTLHTWMKYGLLGVIGYLALFGWMVALGKRKAKSGSTIGAVCLLAIVGFFTVDQFTAAFFQSYIKAFHIVLVAVLLYKAQAGHGAGVRVGDISGSVEQAAR